MQQHQNLWKRETISSPSSIGFTSIPQLQSGNSTTIHNTGCKKVTEVKLRRISLRNENSNHYFMLKSCCVITNFECNKQQLDIQSVKFFSLPSALASVIFLVSPSNYNICFANFKFLFHLYLILFYHIMLVIVSFYCYSQSFDAVKQILLAYPNGQGVSCPL